MHYQCTASIHSVSRPTEWFVAPGKKRIETAGKSPDISLFFME